MSKAIRVNISVQSDLKERMERTAGFNWSAVACSAFEQALSGGEYLTELKAENERLKEKLRAAKAALE